MDLRDGRTVNVLASAAFSLVHPRHHDSNQGGVVFFPRGYRKRADLFTDLLISRFRLQICGQRFMTLKGITGKNFRFFSSVAINILSTLVDFLIRVKYDSIFGSLKYSMIEQNIIKSTFGLRPRGGESSRKIS